ncbi:unnamed protein product, partial [Brenthis ino]
MNNEILIIILLCVYKIECQQIETKIDEESQDEEAEERLEAEDLQKAEEDQEAEEYENRADDKVEEPEQLIEEKESNESDEEQAPPAFVLSIAKQSALLEGTKPKNPSEDIITRNILRTGDFWDSVWKEDVDVDRILRTSNKKSDELERVTVKIDPGSKLYELISKLKKISPTLIYVINKNNNN